MEVERTSIYQAKHFSLKKNLDDILTETIPSPYQHVFLHPDESRKKYTREEGEKLDQRGFETSVLIVETVFNMKGVILQTHWTDNHKYTYQFNMLRDTFKNTVGTELYVAARSTLTSLLVQAFHSERSAYCSFASTLASGLANGGKRMYIESKGDDKEAMLMNTENLNNVRTELCCLMHIIFTKISVRNFFADCAVVSRSRSYLISCAPVPLPFLL